MINSAITVVIFSHKLLFDAASAITSVLRFFEVCLSYFNVVISALLIAAGVSYTVCVRDHAFVPDVSNRMSIEV